MKNIVLILFLSQAGDPGASLFVFGMVKTASRHASRPASQNPPLAGDQLRWPPALSLIPERRHGVARADQIPFRHVSDAGCGVESGFVS
jgi:hypothetical protein